MNVYVKESNIHGHGVFARDHIEKDNWQYVYGYWRVYVPGDITEKYGFREPGEERIYLPYAPWCFTNHSETPNCQVQEGEDNEPLVIVALKNIEPGEELTIDYGTHPDAHLLP